MTDTLNDALLQLGERLANNLIEQGINASAEEGLTTLADKVLEIEGGGGEEEEMQTITVNLQWNDSDDTKHVRPLTTNVYILQDEVVYKVAQFSKISQWEQVTFTVPVGHSYTLQGENLQYYNFSYTAPSNTQLNCTYTLKTGNLRIYQTFDAPEGIDISSFRWGVEGPDPIAPLLLSIADFNEQGYYILSNILPGAYCVYPVSWGGIDTTTANVDLDRSRIATACAVSANNTANVTLYIAVDEIEEEPEETTTEVQAVLIWDDNNNADLNRPENVTVHLYQGGAEENSCILNSANGWTYTFTDLPRFKNDTPIHYSISADPVEQYHTTINGFTIYETYNPETTSSTVTKVWNDYDNALGNRPLSIAMTLNNGMVVVLNAANGWSATITNLPVYIDGEVFDYTWSEQEVLGYQIESVITNDDVTTFTNKPLTVIKPDGKNKDGEELEGSDISNP